MGSLQAPSAAEQAVRSIPFVASVKPGSIFKIDCLEWTGCVERLPARRWS